MKKELNSIAALFYGSITGLAVNLAIDACTTIGRGSAILIAVFSFILFINRIINKHYL